MKLSFLRRADQRANILVTTLVVTGLAGLVLVAYLSMVSQQTKVTARSQTWNSCFAVSEAGVEEALAHLNKNGIGKPNLELGEWKKIRAGVYSVTRDFDDGYYSVSIQTGARPVITSIGYLKAPLAYAVDANDAKKTTPVYLSRTVQVQCRAVGRYTKAIIARNKVELNGKYVKVDSYHSYDTNSSIMGTNGWGTYDPTRIRDHGDVAVIDGLSDTLSISDAEVWGKVSTGPDGNLKTNKNVSVGDVAWHAARKKGVQDGWATDDASFDMPSVIPPFRNGLVPIGGFVGTNYYNYILNDGDYVLNSTDLKGTVLVQGNARLLVKKNVNFKDDATSDDGIDFAAGGRLELYADGDSAKLVGKKDKKKGLISNQLGVNQGGNPTNFMFFGTDRLTKLEIAKNDDVTGIIYAPKAQITLKGGSPKYYHFTLQGAIMGYNVTLEKNISVHYDENIANLEAESYVVEQWNEIATPTTL